jgi:lipoate-protein ligase A
VSGTTWAVEHLQGSPGDFHARPLPDEPTRAVWVCEPDRPALVLGSAQRDGVVDHAACAAAGVEVVRRRSGGGAVLVVPGDLLWVDVILPADDPLWQHDVGRAFLWLGDAWAAALRELGFEVGVHQGALRRPRWSDLVCFAGLGPGEVELAGDPPRKVVGLSQRRTRAAARFQCAALLRWDPAALVPLLAVPPGERAELLAGIAAAGAGLDVGLDVLRAALLRHLP